jgi:hypothetical protein
MPDVLLNNDDITVLGPPEIVELLVDVGATGTRGSQVFVGVGNPNIIEIGQTPLLNDLYINVSPGADYGYLYQYVSQPGGNLWIEVLELNPTIYSVNYVTTYTNGIAQIVIPISNIITSTATPLSANNFSVQFSIVNDNPIAASMSIPAIIQDSDNLVINFKAVEHRTNIDSGPYGDWAVLEGEVTTHLLITIIAVDEES